MKSLRFLLFTILLTGLAAGCGFNKPGGTDAAEKYASEKRSDFGFREIKAGNNVILIITVQEEFAVTVEGEEKRFGDVKTTVEGETLVISTQGGISPANKIRLKISMPELLSLELWGASEATVTNAKSDPLKLQTGGTSTLTIDGVVKSLTAAANGASRIDAENLKTEKTQARSAGAGEITVHATEELEAEAFGASVIVYAGEPKIFKPNIARTGEIRKK
jgi:hypothetical protein